jgi:hypothetical protein
VAVTPASAAPAAAAAAPAARDAPDPVPRHAAAAGRLLTRGAGVLLLAAPLLPLAALFGDDHVGARLTPPGEWLLGAAIFGGAAWLLAAYAPAPSRRALRAAGGVLALRDGVLVPSVLVGLAALLAAVSHVAFRHRPILVDEIVQLFQAQIFADGRIAAPAPALPEFFLTQHMLVDRGLWYAQYPPGHSALLALGARAGVAWVVPIVLTVATAALLHAFVLRAYGRREARLSLLLLALSPFLWFMGASHMNHVSSLFAVALFLLLFARWEGRPSVGRAFAAGCALGLGVLSRPVECLAVGGVFAGIAAGLAIRPAPSPGADPARGPAGPRREPRLGHLGWAALGLALAVSPYLAWNAATTGDPLLPGYVKLWGESHGLGFHVTPWGELHTPLVGVRNELTDLALLAEYLFEWPLPALWPAGLLFAAGWGSRRWDGRLLAAFLAVPAAYLFYWHRDAFLGPRFLYAVLAFAVPLTARAILEGATRLPDLPRRLGALRVPSLRHAAGVALVLAAGYAIFYAAPARLRVYAGGMASVKADLGGDARRAGLGRALVFVPESWGSRILAEARALGVPASLAERAYRTTDHCRFDGLLREARLRGWPAARVAAELEALAAAGGPLVRAPLAGDPTLRLAPGAPLPPRCVRELLRDRQGFGVFTAHLPLNRPALDGELVVARDLGERNGELRALHPHRRAWLYRRGRFLPLP